jgi:hypothetical protein
MDQIREMLREQLEKPLVVGVAGFVLGLILGWFVIGWGIWPVVWQDAAPQHLRADLKEDYLRMVIDSNVLHPDATRLATRWEDLQPGAEEVLAAIEADPQAQVNDIAGFKAAIGAEPAAETVAEGEETVSEEPADEAAAEEKSGSNLTGLLVLCLVTLVLGGGLAAYFLYRPGRRNREEASSPAVEAIRVSQETPQTDFEVRDGLPPIAQFMTTYMLGDDLFDDSFSIDAPIGEFLGECGVGISEPIGVGEPKKVTAFEVWLFDKNDIQTVTKVLMSRHAFTDSSLRTRLAAKGDPFEMQPGSETELETATLRLVARVVDMAYGAGASPADSYFERVTLELAVWQKE